MEKRLGMQTQLSWQKASTFKITSGCGSLWSILFGQIWACYNSSMPICMAWDCNAPFSYLLCLKTWFLSLFICLSLSFYLFVFLKTEFIYQNGNWNVLIWCFRFGFEFLKWKREGFWFKWSFQLSSVSIGVKNGEGLNRWKVLNCFALWLFWVECSFMFCIWKNGKI